MTKKRFHTSLQLKLTLLLSLLMIISCVLMYFFISHSAVSGMDGLQNYMIKVDPQDGDSPITFNVDPKALFPQFEQEIQETKEAFLLRIQTAFHYDQRTDSKAFPAGGNPS